MYPHSTITTQCWSIPSVMNQLAYSPRLWMTSSLLQSVGCGLASLIRISIPSRAFPKVLPYTKGFAGSLPRSSWLISFKPANGAYNQSHWGTPSFHRLRYIVAAATSSFMSASFSDISCHNASCFAAVHP